MHPTFGEEDKIHGVEAARPMTAEAKLSNFFYHYKWHVIAAAVLVLIVIICACQCGARKEYDAYVMYAGDKGLLSTQTLTISQKLSALCGDYDENGEVLLSFNSLYIADYDKIKDSPDAAYYAALTHENRAAFDNELQTGNYLIFLLSEDLFRELDTETGIFIPILPSSGVPAEKCLYASEADLPTGIRADMLCGTENGGIKLSSLPLAALPGLSALPNDTVLCIRQPSAIAAWYKSALPWAKNDDAARLENHKTLFRALLSYAPEE